MRTPHDSSESRFAEFDVCAGCNCAAECRFDEVPLSLASRFYCYAVPHSAECRDAVCHCADYHYAKCHYAECCGAAGRERGLPKSEEQTYVCANINKPY